MLHVSLDDLVCKTEFKYRNQQFFHKLFIKVSLFQLVFFFFELVYTRIVHVTLSLDSEYQYMHMCLLLGL